MAIEEISAGTQYGDWKGSAQADDNDNIDLSKFLREKGWASDGDHVVGCDFFCGEIHQRVVDRNIYVHAFVQRKDQIDNRGARGEISVDRISFNLPLAEFFGLFKRFSVAITRHGENQRVDVVNEIDTE